MKTVRLSPKRPEIKTLIMSEQLSDIGISRQLKVSQYLVRAVRAEMKMPHRPQPPKPKVVEVSFSYGAPKYRIAILKLEQAGHIITDNLGLRMNGRPVSYGRLIELAELL